MKTMRVFRILTGLLMIFVTLAAVSPAYANTMYHSRTYVTNDSTWAGDDPYNPCGFNLYFHSEGYIVTNILFDNSGWYIHYVNGNGNISGTVSSDWHTVISISRGPTIVSNRTENEWIIRYPATIVIFMLPGYGKIMGGMGQTVIVDTYDPNTGEWTETVRSVGKAEITPEDWTTFCEFMGP